MPPPAATQAAAGLWTARVTNPPHLLRIPTKCRDNGNWTVCSWLKLAINDPASCKTRFTRGRVRESKNRHNSVTVQNRTHIYMNFFHHKGLGNQLLQLCPKVVKHPVFPRFSQVSWRVVTMDLQWKRWFRIPFSDVITIYILITYF